MTARPTPKELAAWRSFAERAGVSASTVTTLRLLDEIDRLSSLATAVRERQKSLRAMDVATRVAEGHAGFDRWQATQEAYCKADDAVWHALDELDKDATK